MNRLDAGASEPSRSRTTNPRVPADSPEMVTHPPLAEAKVAAPVVRRGMMDRPRIEHALDAGSDARLTLVAAPAGYGKTTAVRAWCAGRDAALAWVTLDAGDNDPVRLWLYVATAVDRVRPGLGGGALRRLSLSGAVEEAVDELLNAVTAFGRELTIVLDDLQTVTDADALASIDYALAHLPANARLVLLTRADPALGLARLRASGGARRAARERARLHPCRSAASCSSSVVTWRSGPRRPTCSWTARRAGPPPSSWPASGSEARTIPPRRCVGSEDTSASWAST